MKDLIERQEAIDRIEAIFPVDPHANECAEGVAIGAALAKQYIETLPSAQPEQPWIPCSEKLPEKNCRCLTTNTAWGAFEVDWNAWINGEWLYPNEKPIAWMPLPEPYKENDHD